MILLNLSDNTFSIFLQFLHLPEIIKLEKINPKLSQKIQNQDNIFQEYIETHFPRIVRQGNLYSSWFSLCKRINQNSYYCLYCGSYMGIGPIVRSEEHTSELQSQ